MLYLADHAGGLSSVLFVQSVLCGMSTLRDPALSHGDTICLVLIVLSPLGSCF